MIAKHKTTGEVKWQGEPGTKFEQIKLVLRRHSGLLEVGMDGFIDGHRCWSWRTFEKGERKNGATLARRVHQHQDEAAAVELIALMTAHRTRLGS